MSILSSALEYAAFDLQVIPFKPRSKHPLLKNWVKRATIKKPQLKRWFKDDSLNVGLVMGNGVFAIDIDERHGGVESFQKFLAGRGIPHTAIQETAGGFHYLFRTNRKIKTVTGFMPGLDIRGENSAIVVEPSIHPSSGQRYSWIYHPSGGIAEAPEWIIELLAQDVPASQPSSPLPGGRAGDSNILANDLISRFPVREPGTRNARMVQAACSLLGRGFDGETAHDALAAWWEHFHDLGLISTHPSEAPKMIAGTIHSIEISGTLRKSTGGHTEALRQVTLTDAQRETLNTIHTGLTLVCRNAQERAFVEALITHFTYEAEKTEGELLPATSPQLAKIVYDRHGISLAPPQIERLKRKYVSREGRPAERCELVVQVKTGVKGTPSQFQLTGLTELFGVTPSLVSDGNALVGDGVPVNAGYLMGVNPPILAEINFPSIPEENHHVIYNRTRHRGHSGVGRRNFKDRQHRGLNFSYFRPALAFQGLYQRTREVVSGSNRSHEFDNLANHQKL